MQQTFLSPPVQVDAVGYALQADRVVSEEATRHYQGGDAAWRIVPSAARRSTDTNPLACML